MARPRKTGNVWRFIRLAIAYTLGTVGVVLVGLIWPVQGFAPFSTFLIGVGLCIAAILIGGSANVARRLGDLLRSQM
jgi:hypothetical protein